jgi:HK97 family phage major capsid protein
VPLISQSAKGTAYWTGEGKGKPVTKMGAGRTELAPLKIAVITAATMELLRDSSPSAERLIRDDLAAGIVEGIDMSFIDPTNAGVSNIEPAAITYDNAAMNVASGGGGAENVRHDVRAAMAKFVAAGNSLTSGVWIMSAQQALALSMMVNDLEQRLFPGINVNGGTFFELPVITSEHVSGYVVLVNAQDIWLGDEGGISIDMSTEASLEMRAGDDEGPTLNIGASTPVAASLVSLWQTNSVGFRAERTINWARRRAAAVSTITSVAWGMEVDSPAS